MVRRLQAGFTLVELMIAITVFSVAILVATSGAVVVGRMYQQSVTKAKLLTAAREIQGQFTQEIQYSGTVPVPSPDLIDGLNALCIGNTRYRWSTDTDNNKLIKEEFKNKAPCNDPSADPPADPSDSPTLLKETNPLPKSARVTKFDYDDTSGLYSLSIRFVIGDDDMFEDNDIKKDCKANILGSEFCATVELENQVARKVEN